MFRYCVVALATLGVVTTANPAMSSADPIGNGIGYAVVPAMIAGSSPDALGAWNVQYERLAGGNADGAAAINDGIDAEATEQVQRATWDASTRRPWTFDTKGTLSVGPITVASLFIGTYNTDERGMPAATVGTRVFDGRSGVVITWGNLFRDKNAGLARLAEVTAALLPAAYPPPHSGDWGRNGALAPLDMNYQYWVPSRAGIELHFPDFQFGRGLKTITVPWAAVQDLIAPEFLPITGA